MWGIAGMSAQKGTPLGWSLFSSSGYASLPAIQSGFVIAKVCEARVSAGESGLVGVVWHGSADKCGKGRNCMVLVLIGIG